MENNFANEIDRRVLVCDPCADSEIEKTLNWQFNYDPGIDSEGLNERTKHCHIQKYPDMEYNYFVEVNGKKFFLVAFGEGAIIQTCMLCILLDNQKLDTLLNSLEISQGQLSYYARRAIERQLLPKTGPFYYFNGEIRTSETYMRVVNPDTYERGQLDINAQAGEHRDLWDNYMLVLYPELTEEYNADDHKSMPRGRVDCKTVNGKLTFWVTLDKCIKDKEDEIKRRFKLTEYDVEFHFGTINYKCIHCKGD